MVNAWINMKPHEYDLHMSHPNVEQTQMLNRIIEEQFFLLPQHDNAASHIAVLGITNGNGLEHASKHNISSVIGIDINRFFLNECYKQYNNIAPQLVLYQMDLMNEANTAIDILSECRLVIANLIIKHIHLDNFMKIINGLPCINRIVSCVIQVNPDGIAVSKSGYEHFFEGIANQREEENEEQIVNAMINIGYSNTGRFVYDLPNGKHFVRLDFTFNISQSRIV